MCRTATEDRRHLLLHCPALENIRHRFLRPIIDLISTAIYNNLDDEEKIRLLLDSNHTVHFGIECDIGGLEAAQRTYLFRIHCKRSSTTAPE